ncbi:MAG TPA: hypothetical protein VHY20_00380, partial [Pirellulales bacterium]|nr:hypothetical protein [Pirellulales bacterium]
LTLYELLTLETPYQESSPARLLKLISEHEPQAPRHRNPAIPRDLETIVLKAIAREPNHRYASARDLAEDLRCYLDDRPIQARRVAAWERGWRWCRRNRGSAALAATALAFLVLAAVVGWWGYVSTVRALDRESQRRLEAEAATQRADANVELSLEALQNIFATLAQHKEPAPHEPTPAISINALATNSAENEKRPKRDEHKGPDAPDEPPPPPPSKEEFDAALLQTVLKFYDRFAEQNPTDPKLQVVAAGAFSQVAELHRRLEEFDAAATDYGRAVQVYARLEQDFPNEARYAAAKADVEMRWAALPGSAATLESRRARAKQAGQIAAELAKRFPDQPDYRSLAAKAQWTLGLIGRQAGQKDDAEISMREAIKQQRQLVDEPERGRAYLAGLIAMQHELAEFLVSIDRVQDARSLVESSLALLEDGRPDRHTRRMLGPQYNQYADVLQRLGKTDEAATMRERAAQLHRDGPPDGPPGMRGEGGPRDGRPGGGGGRHDDGPPGFGPRGFGPPPGMGPPPFEGREGRGPPRAGGPRGNGPGEGPLGRGPREPGDHPPPRRGADPSGPPDPPF